MTPTVVVPRYDALHDTTAEPTVEPTTIRLGCLRTVLLRSLLLLGEVVAVPGVLLYVLVAAGHPMAGLVAVFVWRAPCIVVRLAARSRVPATCWLAFGLFATRTAAGLAVSSVGLYLLIPIALCAAQGLFFLVSALSRRPVLMRLAGDFTGELPDCSVLRRLFAQLSAIWGTAHLVCAGVGAWALTLSTTRAVAVTSALGVTCTLASVGGCIAWGLWRIGRIPGFRIEYGAKSNAASGPSAPLTGEPVVEPAVELAA